MVPVILVRGFLQLRLVDNCKLAEELNNVRMQRAWVKLATTMYHSLHDTRSSTGGQGKCKSMKLSARVVRVKAFDIVACKLQQGLVSQVQAVYLRGCYFFAVDMQPSKDCMNTSVCLLGRNILTRCCIKRIASLKSSSSGSGGCKALNRGWRELGMVNNTRHASRLVVKHKDPPLKNIANHAKWQENSEQDSQKPDMCNYKIFAITDVCACTVREQGYIEVAS